MCYKYSKTPLNADPLNDISVLSGSIGISLNRTLYWYLLYMCANETAIQQPKVVHCIATVYTMYIFQPSFVSLSRI